MTQLVFLISLPRSGSTLLQSILSVSPDIATCAEPWILLPLLNMRNPAIARAAYFHHTAAAAINEFIGQIPDGEKIFDSAITDLATRLYDTSARGRRYFLDKTPRYYLMIPEIRRLFPDARFIFLVRHPLAVLASIADFFNNGRFRWFEYWIDWIEGHHCMAEAIRQNEIHCCTLHYEDIVTQPGDTMRTLCEWLDIQFTEEMISSYPQRPIPGRMGDKKGLHHYTGVSPEPLQKWHEFFDTPHRQAAARRMINKLRPEDLEILGYPADSIFKEIAELPVRKSLDLPSRADSLINWVAYCLDFRYLQARYRAARGKRRYAYGFYRHH